MVSISFWTEVPHVGFPPDYLVVRVVVTGWLGWHTLRLARSLLLAEGQFWWSLGRQDGIVGKGKGGRVLRLISRFLNTPDGID